MYGATGVAAGEIAAYSYWCVEKGYPSFVGGDRDAAGWTSRAKGWIRVVQTDVWVTLVILTCATLSFYFLGAGVLHRLEVLPQGSETIHVLSAANRPGDFWRILLGIHVAHTEFSHPISASSSPGCPLLNSRASIMHR